MRLQLLKADVGKAGSKHMTIDFRDIGSFMGPYLIRPTLLGQEKPLFFNSSSDGWTLNFSISSENDTEF